MANTEIYYGPGVAILAPASTSYLNRLEPAGFGPNLTIPKGMALGQKTSTARLYPLNKAATDGTQTFKAFNQNSIVTDANSNCYFVYGGTTAVPNYVSAPSGQSAVWTGGVFDPADLFTAPTGTAVKEVDTITPTTPTAGDAIGVYNAAGVGVTIVVEATPSATSVCDQLREAWGADPACTALAVATGTATFILTAVNAGTPLGLSATMGTGATGTVALVVTTAAVAAQQAPVYTITPTGSVTTGDVYTVTITYPNGTTHAVSATVGSTQSATGAVTVLKAAWAADLVASALATASGTATFILTGVLPGNALSLTASVVGTGTVSAVVVTTPAYGRSIADILPGNPGAHILASGFWEIP